MNQPFAYGWGIAGDYRSSDRHSVTLQGAIDALVASFLQSTSEREALEASMRTALSEDRVYWFPEWFLQFSQVDYCEVNGPGAGASPRGA